jgi:hypothetical protein
MDIYTALLDRVGHASDFIGAFSTEGKARAACQDHYDEDNAVSRRYDEACAPFGDLPWKEDRAVLDDGDEYVVVLTSLDVPTGQG